MDGREKEENLAPNAVRAAANNDVLPDPSVEISFLVGKMGEKKVLYQQIPNNVNWTNNKSINDSFPADRKFGRRQVPQCLIMEAANDADRLIVVNWWRQLSAEEQNSEWNVLKKIYIAPSKSKKKHTHHDESSIEIAALLLQKTKTGVAHNRKKRATHSSTNDETIKNGTGQVKNSSNADNNRSSPPAKKKKKQKKNDISSSEVITSSIPSWGDMFYHLAVYKAKNGNCLVPHDSKTAESPLGVWVREQRSRKKKDKLTNDQIDALNTLGFVWDTQKEENNQLWEKYYNDLIKYKEEHGTLKIPRKETTLSKWTNRQRELQSLAEKLQSGKTIQRSAASLPKWCTGLSRERKEKLDKIGFVWKLYNRNENGWDGMFDQLVEYKQNHGNCRVPQHWPTNKSLGKWVAKQRYEYSLSELSEEKMLKLNSLDFDWGKTRPNAWKSANNAKKREA